MRLTLAIHIIGGSVALLAGYCALYAAKGGTLHRRSGLLFVCAMLPMCAAGFTIAIVSDVAPAINVPAALLTSYLVVTSLTSIRPPRVGGRWLGLSAMAIALGVGLASLAFGVEAVANGGTRKGMPAFPFFMFGIVGLLGFAGDVRVIRFGAPRGTARLARHLWRMSFALFIAALSFFIGQAQVIPKPIRFPPLLAIPVIAVFVTMLYWLWRVRVRGSLRLSALGARRELSAES